MPRALRTSDCVLDGVICALDDAGQPSRKLLDEGGGTVVYVVFDLLEYETEPLLDTPWKARRKTLEGLLDDSIAELRFSRAYDDGSAPARRGQGSRPRHRRQAPHLALSRRRGQRRLASAATVGRAAAAPASCT